jgi:hypothetical protein
VFFNDKQNETRLFDNDYRPKILLADGAIGSGKTRIIESCWYAHQWEVRERNQDHILTGYTLSSLERNVLKPLHDNFEIDTRLDDDNAFHLWGNRYYCFGTNDAHSWKAIRGIETAYSHYGNEITLSHKTSFDEVGNRLRGRGARYFWETNPEGKNHYIYKTFIEPTLRNGNTKDLARFNFTVYDNDEAHNGFLPAEYIKQQEERHTGILHRKLNLGEWCSIEGQIYFLEELQYYDDSVLNDPRWFNGAVVNGYMDPATGSQIKTGCFTSALAGALKYTPENPEGTIYLTDAVVKKIMPNQLNNAVGELIRKRNYSVFAVEDNFSQDGYVVQPLRKAFPFVNIQGQSSREDKLSRLVGMHSIVMNRVKFPERWQYEKNSDGWLLLQQLCNITKERDGKAETDEEMFDAPDALEGLIRTFKNYSGMSSGVSGGESVEEKQTW